MSSNFDLTNSEAIERLEEWFQRPLPEDFKNWLLDPNALYPVPAEVSIPDESPWIAQIQCLYAPQQILESLHEDNKLVHQGVPSRYPRKTFPIGENHSELYLISLRDQDHGSVLFLFHETASSHNDYEGAYTLAPSFGPWLSSLDPLPEEEEDKDEDDES